MEKDDHITVLQRQHHKYSAAIAEFEAVEAELKLRPRTARTLDMIRLNRETINAMKRSIELIEERMRHREHFPRQLPPGPSSRANA